MDFDLTEEQRLLRDSVGRVLTDRYTFEKRKAYLAEPDGWSRELWAQYAELGLLGLPFAEQHGGFGGGGVEVMVVMEALGRALALEPYLATVVLAGTALRLAGSEAQQAASYNGYRLELGEPSRALGESALEVHNGLLLSSLWDVTGPRPFTPAVANLTRIAFLPLGGRALSGSISQRTCSPAPTR